MSPSTLFLFALCQASPALQDPRPPLRAPRAVFANEDPTSSRTMVPQRRPWPGSRRRGVYLKLFGGLGQLQDADLALADGIGGFSEGDVAFEVGFVAGGAVGWRFSDHWALEAEVAFRRDTIDSFEASGTTVADSGDFSSTSVLANLLFSFDTNWRLDPYVGLGYGFVDRLDVDLDRAGGFTGDLSYRGDSFAWQALVGLEARVHPRWSLFLEGRYFDVLDGDLDGTDNPGDVETEVGHVGLTLGLTFGL